jgi:hypothetical protein
MVCGQIGPFPLPPPKFPGKCGPDTAGRFFVVGIFVCSK